MHWNIIASIAYKCLQNIIHMFISVGCVYMYNKTPHLPAPMSAHLWFVHLFSNSSFCAVCFGFVVSFIRLLYLFSVQKFNYWNCILSGQSEAPVYFFHLYFIVVCFSVSMFFFTFNFFLFLAFFVCLFLLSFSSRIALFSYLVTSEIQDVSYLKLLI